MPSLLAQPHTVVDARPSPAPHHTLRVVPVLDTGLVLAVPPIDLPAHVSWNGEDFVRRSEFHVVLVGRHEVDSLARQWAERTGRDREEGRDVVCRVLRDIFPAAQHLFRTIDLEDDLLLVERDVRRAIIQRCFVSGLADFFTAFRQSLAVHFPGGTGPELALPDTHVTLYSPSESSSQTVSPDEERIVHVVLGEDGRITSATP